MLVNGTSEINIKLINAKPSQIVLGHVKKSGKKCHGRKKHKQIYYLPIRFKSADIGK